MKKVNFGKTTVAVGLYWANISGDKPSAEMSSIKKELSKPYGVLKKISKKDSKDVYQVALTDKKELNGVISGASALAELQKTEDVIFLYELNDEEVWLVAVAEGEIIIGSDKVISHEEAKDALYGFISEYIKEPIIVVSQEIIDNTDIEKDNVDEVISFNGIFEKIGYNKIQKDFASSKIKANSDLNKTLLLGGVAAALVGFVVFNSMPEEKKAPVYVPPEIVAPVEPVIPENVMTNDEKLFLAAYEEEKLELYNSFDTDNPSKTMKRLATYNLVIDRYVGGWEATTMSYDSVSPNDIFVSWRKGPYGTAITLRQDILENEFLSIPVGGDTATSFHNLVDSYSGEVGKIDILDYIKNSNYGYESLSHDLTSLGLKIEVFENEELERKNKIEGLRDETDEYKKQLVLNSKHVIISGANIDELMILVQVIKKAPAFKLNKISINLESGASWVVDGDLYEN